MGDVDTDIEQEEGLGLPVIGAKSLKGLLAEECSLILRAFKDTSLQNSASRIFGSPGQEDSGILSLKNALLPDCFRDLVKDAVEDKNRIITPHLVLQSLTTIRYQTAIDRCSGAASDRSLRNTRVTLPGIVLHAPFVLATDNNLDRALFASCLFALRRGGLNRNRGWGKMKVRICQQKNQSDITASWAAGLTVITGGSQ
jgi:CRISPR/Cas system CSM-associated protein Csm3 (group 7 of RAMP superfamily)